MKKIALFLISCIFLSVSDLSAQVKVLAFSGSTRSESLNKKLVLEAAATAQQMGAIVTVIDLKDYPMPLYDGDLEEHEGLPANAKKIRQLIQENQVILIASPNYNGSYSGTLKNLFDWVSRTESKAYDKTILNGKVFALMSASPGKTGGSKALDPLRTLIETLRGKVVTAQVSVPEAHAAFNDEYRLKDPRWTGELQLMLQQAFQQSM